MLELFLWLFSNGPIWNPLFQTTGNRDKGKGY